MRNMVKRRLMRGAAASMSAVLLAGMLPITSFAAVEFGWEEEDGKAYWYEDGVKQGTEGRGKEIYDPGTEAWYWLDAPDGVKAVSKDVYQESEAGQWGDYIVDGVRYGKWVRYDSEGRMIKGWTDAGDYYFDLTYGTMAKGYATVDGTEYYFNTETGVKERELGAVPEGNGWKTIDGEDFWYENGVRQGYSVDASYRGKEIYDPGSDAWYWLDNVDGGKKAVSKDVYQESQADDQGTMGKWVRYDENGHMIKGWDTNDNGTYYFDPIYGTMTKGYATIDGVRYYFDPNTGICQGEVTENNYISWHVQRFVTYNDDGTIQSYYEYEYDDTGKETKYTYYQGNKYNSADGYHYAENEQDVYVSTQRETSYDENGKTKQVRYKSTSYNISTQTGSLYYEYVTDYNAGVRAKQVYKYYKDNGDIKRVTVYTYNQDGDVLETRDYSDDQKTLTSVDKYEYGADRAVSKTKHYDGSETLISYDVYTYTGTGKISKEESFNAENVLQYTNTYSYNSDDLLVSEERKYEVGGYVTGRTEYTYNSGGNVEEEINYYLNYQNYELIKSHRYTYEYDQYGNEAQKLYYTYDSNGKESLEGKQEYTYYEPAEGSTYTPSHTYDNYRSHYVVDENGHIVYDEDGTSKRELGYSYGWEYVRENGAVVKYIDYTGDENYEKSLSRYTEYCGSWTFPSTDKAGEVFKLDPASTTYDANGKRLYYTVSEYVSYLRKYTEK